MLVFEMDVEELADLDGRVEADIVGLELLDLDGLELSVVVGDDVCVFDLGAVSVTLDVTKLDGDDRDDVDAVFEVSPDWVRAGVDDEVLDCVTDLVEVIVDVVVLVEVEDGDTKLLGYPVFVDVVVFVDVLDAVLVGESGIPFTKSCLDSYDTFSVLVKARVPRPKSNRSQFILYYISI